MRIQLGQDFTSRGAQHRASMHAAQNALALASMFNRPAGAELYLPQVREPEYQVVAADVDGDGDEDQTAVRNMPLTDSAGKVIAAGATADIEFEPLRWVKILNFIVAPTLANATLLLQFLIGQDNQFPSRGAIPMTAFAADATDKQIDVPWCGPGVPLILQIKNTSLAEVTFYGAARCLTIIG